eukprot:366399-Chlamydomonas_euryale.AAC.54
METPDSGGLRPLTAGGQGWREQRLGGRRQCVFTAHTDGSMCLLPHTDGNVCSLPHTCFQPHANGSHACRSAAHRSGVHAAAAGASDVPAPLAPLVDDGRASARSRSEGKGGMPEPPPPLCKEGHRPLPVLAFAAATTAAVAAAIAASAIADCVARAAATVAAAALPQHQRFCAPERHRDDLGSELEDLVCTRRVCIERPQPCCVARQHHAGAAGAAARAVANLGTPAPTPASAPTSLSTPTLALRNEDGAGAGVRSWAQQRMVQLPGGCFTGGAAVGSAASVPTWNRRRQREALGQRQAATCRPSACEATQSRGVHARGGDERHHCIQRLVLFRDTCVRCVIVAAAGAGVGRRAGGTSLRRAARGALARGARTRRHGSVRAGPIPLS